LKKFLKSLSLLLVAGGGFFILGILVTNSFIMPRVVHQGGEVKVPDLNGKSLEEGRDTLETLGLKVFVKQKVFDQVALRGTIIGQDPLPDEVVKGKRTVELILSLGPEEVVVPYLIRLPLFQAENLIRRTGLVVGKITETLSDSIPPGGVIRCDPPPAKSVQSGTVVRLWVSKGKGLQIPDLVGRPLADVKDSLIALGLVIPPVTTIPGEEVARGTILLQNPLPGTKASMGDTLKLAVSGIK
jgi:serine/threonine-protein kinase